MSQYWVNVRCVCTYKIKVSADLADNAASNAQDLLDEEVGTIGGDILPMEPDFCKDYFVVAQALEDDPDELEIAEED